MTPDTFAPQGRRPIAYPPPHVSLLADIQRYIGFGTRDAEALANFLPSARPHFPEVAAHFYELILEHPSAHAAITGGVAQVERLKQTLVRWMETGLSGPHDEAYFERRCRIGRVHVEIGLPQRFMFTAMNVIRLDFRQIVRSKLDDPDRARRTSDALDKLFDMELAIMLHAYQTDSEEKLRKRERLAVVGQVAASIGHELRNPLGVIRSSSYLLQQYVEGEKARRHLDKIDHQVARCTRIIEGLLELTRDRPIQRQDVDVAELTREVAADLLGAREGGLSVHLAPAGPGGYTVRADPAMLRQVLENLLHNAAFAGNAAQVTVGVRHTPSHEAVFVEDDGCGFPAALLERAFEPLVSTRPHGTGLGLALVMAVARRHGGSAVAENRPGGGARVVVRWPVEGAQADP